jgi:hypothetical protein
MNLSDDFHDLLAAFESSRAEYLLIGGYAVSLHSEPRYTKDIDLWIGPCEPSRRNEPPVRRDRGGYGIGV